MPYVHSTLLWRTKGKRETRARSKQQHTKPLVRLLQCRCRGSSAQRMSGCRGCWAAVRRQLGRAEGNSWAGPPCKPPMYNGRGKRDPLSNRRICQGVSVPYVAHWGQLLMWRCISRRLRLQRKAGRRRPIRGIRHSLDQQLPLAGGDGENGGDLRQKKDCPLVSPGGWPTETDAWVANCASDRLECRSLGRASAYLFRAFAFRTVCWRYEKFSCLKVAQRFSI